MLLALIVAALCVTVRDINAGVIKGEKGILQEFSERKSSCWGRHR